MLTRLNAFASFLLRLLRFFAINIIGRILGEFYASYSWVKLKMPLDIDDAVWIVLKKGEVKILKAKF
jgi:hypothetical protein